MKLIFLDTETTGLKTEKGDRIIEICMIRVDTDKWKSHEFYEQRFLPDKAIDVEAQAIHGISMADLKGCPKFEEKIDEVSEFIESGDLVIAHNLDFDSGFLVSEYQLAGKKLPSTKGFCTMKAGRWACFDGKMPNLKELCFALGVPYDPALAHAALYDTQVLVACTESAVARGFFNLEGETK